MSTHKGFDRIAVIVTVLSLLVTILFMNGERLGITVVVDADTEAHSDSKYFTANDLKGDWDTAEATVITLEGDSARISGNGAYWLDGHLTIVQSGQYVISGQLDDGNIVVNAEKYSKIWIQLSGVTIHCSDDACIRVDQADKVFLTLAEDTENHMTGPESFSETALADGTNAVIFTHDDLTINGSGSLTLEASCENGITAKDDLVITGGAITITAPYHGIRVNDSFRFTAAALTMTAGQDGIHTEGQIVIQDGTFDITAQDDAMHSDTAAYILGGTIRIADCYEGIEAVVIEIHGGDITINARDDGLNANGYTGFAMGGGMAMPEMNGEAPSGEMGAMGPPDMAGEGISMNNTESSAVSETSQTAESTEAVETTEPVGTEATETAENTGMPQMGPIAGGEMPRMEGMEAEASVEEQTLVTAEETYILITGGRLTALNATGMDADGIDSNGNIRITGGTVFVSMAGDLGSNAMDVGSESGGTAVITGGTVIACGSGGMAENFSEDSTQASILYGTGENTAAGTTVSLLDAEGQMLLSETIPYSFSSVLISCPQLTVGGKGQIVIGETAEEIEMTSVSVSAGTSVGMLNMGDPNGGMGFPSMTEGGTPPEMPEGMTPPEGMEGMQPPTGGFGPGGQMPENTETEETTSTEY